MKKIELELMTQYRCLSNLLSWKNSLLYTETLADTDANDYTQTLRILDPETKEDKVLYGPFKRIAADVVNGDLFIRESGKDGLVETVYYRLDDEGKKEVFRVPFSASDLKAVKEGVWLFQGETDRRCPDYYLLSEEEKKAFHDSEKKEEDYLVLDEYPFFYNGVGFINGKRNSLYLYDEKDASVKRITPETMDVESLVVEEEKIFFLGNDYESMKTMFASIYCYDVSTGECVELYHNEKAFISRILSAQGRLFALTAFDTCISGHSFYEVKDGDLELVCKSEWMFSNSIGTDCRYGKSHGMVKKDGDVYLITVDQERSIVVKFDGEKLTNITDGEGSVDDMAFLNGKLYVTAMKDMKLQEVYEAPSFTQLSGRNEEVLKDRYVARPERFTCFNVDEIVGWALKPVDYDPSKKYPMILDIHSGPKTAYGEVFYHEMQVWANRGYFVIFCNPHCSDGRGDDFADYIKHYGATDYFDIMAFVDKALELYPAIDPDRLAVTGGSYGGYMTNWIITHTDRFKAAASQRSISNRVADFYYSDYSYDTTYENGIPLDEKAIELFWDRSPLKYVENAVTPTLFIQSTEDYRCPFPEALQLFSALKWKGVETRICGFKGENHELSRSGKPLHRLRRLKEITEWLEKYTKE